MHIHMTDPTFFYRSVPFGKVFFIAGLIFYLYIQYQSFQRRIRDIIILSITIISLCILTSITIGALRHISIPILKLDREGIEYVSTFGIKKTYAWRDIQIKITRERTFKSTSYHLVIYSNSGKRLTSINMYEIDISKQGIINALNRYHYCKEEI